LQREQQIWTRRRKRSRSENKAKTDLFVAFLGVFAGNGVAHSRQEGEEGRQPLRISPRSLDSRAASRGGAWRRRAATSQMPRNLLATIPAVAEGLPCNSCRFWRVYFVILKLYLIFLNSCFFYM
jgi:hypothetical protein